jgi:hypothetical protein
MTDKNHKSSDKDEKEHPVSAHKKSISKSISTLKEEKKNTSGKSEKSGVKSEDWNDPTGNSHLSAKK